MISGASGLRWRIFRPKSDPNLGGWILSAEVDALFRLKAIVPSEV